MKYDDLDYNEEEYEEDYDPDVVYCEECGCELESETLYHNMDYGQVEEYVLACPNGC